MISLLIIIYYTFYFFTFLSINTKINQCVKIDALFIKFEMKKSLKY